MATAGLDKEAFKRALKEALAETLHEQRELFREIFAEVLEDLALAEAIREGQKTKSATRAEVFRLLQGPRMKATFRKSFTRDLKKVGDQRVRDRVREAVEQVEAAANVQAIANVKKLSGPGNYSEFVLASTELG